MGKDVGTRLRGLWEKYARGLLGYTRSLMSGGALYKDAEDIVGEAFLRLMDRIGRGGYADKEDEELKRILMRICRNLVIDEQRRAGRVRMESFDDYPGEEEPDPSPTPEEIAEERDEARRARAVLISLPPEQRCILEMRLVEGLSFAQIAKELGITENNAAVRFFRAKEEAARRLRKGEGNGT